LNRVSSAESDNKNIMTFAKKDYLEFYLHGKNSFAERLLKFYVFLDIGQKNNFVELSK